MDRCRHADDPEGGDKAEIMSRTAGETSRAWVTNEWFPEMRDRRKRQLARSSARPPRAHPFRIRYL
jgi:hypothetical protein